MKSVRLCSFCGVEFWDGVSGSRCMGVFRGVALTLPMTSVFMILMSLIVADGVFVPRGVWEEMSWNPQTDRLRMLLLFYKKSSWPSCLQGSGMIG